MAVKKRKSSKRQARAVRSDATIGKTEREIEKNFKLPAGSVTIHLPSGRDARSDKKIGKLLKDWD